MVALSFPADKRVNERSTESNYSVRSFIVSVLLLVSIGCSSHLDNRGTFPHKVAAGDTLFDLSQRYGVSIDEIKSFNAIDDPRALRVGQVIQIPRSLYRDYQLIPSESGRAAMEFSRLEIQQRLKIPLYWPVNGSAIMSSFGDRSGSFHEGLDLKGAEGDPVFAAHAGEVAYSGEGLSGYGNLLVLRGNGFFTVYAHNSRLLVKKGAQVARGDEIAEVGQTGRASAPHLHFELRMRNGEGRYEAVNPLPFLKKRDT